MAEDHPFGKRCPNCLGETKVVVQRTSAMQKNTSSFLTAVGLEIKLSALLDNIRSAWNVGSIFRTADGLGVKQLYLCGITPTPENEAIHKTSLGAEETVAWEYSRNALETAKELKAKGHTLIGLEQDSRAIPLDAINKDDFQKTVLIIGNEVTGVDPEILDLCDQIVHIPMHGQKLSFNVEVAFAIAAYALRY